MDGSRPKLADFGLSRQASERLAVQSGRQQQLEGEGVAPGGEDAGQDAALLTPSEVNLSHGTSAWMAPEIM